MGHARALYVVLATAALFACGPSREDLRDLIVEAGACAPADACVLAGQSQCTCGGPVNAARKAEVDAFASSIQCGSMTVLCGSLGDFRCEAGRCTADEGE